MKHSSFSLGKPVVTLWSTGTKTPFLRVSCFQETNAGKKRTAVDRSRQSGRAEEGVGLDGDCPHWPKRVEQAQRKAWRSWEFGNCAGVFQQLSKSGEKNTRVDRACTVNEGHLSPAPFRDDVTTFDWLVGLRVITNPPQPLNQEGFHSRCIIRFIFQTDGRSPTVWDAHGSAPNVEIHPRAAGRTELLVMRNLRCGAVKFRFLDIKIGQKTAQAVRASW